MEEVWYTHKKKGICHGVPTGHMEDLGRIYDKINGEWIESDRQFSSEQELRDTLDRYLENLRMDDLEHYGNVSCGYCTFRSTGNRYAKQIK